MRPPETCCSIAYSSAMRTGSFVVISVVEVETTRRSVGRGDRGEQRRGRRGHEGRVVVLAEREDVEADLLRLPRDGEHGLDPLGLAGGLARHRVPGDVADGEHTELHPNQLLVPAGQPPRDPCNRIQLAQVQRYSRRVGDRRRWPDGRVRRDDAGLAGGVAGRAGARRRARPHARARRGGGRLLRPAGAARGREGADRRLPRREAPLARAVLPAGDRPHGHGRHVAPRRAGTGRGAPAVRPELDGFAASKGVIRFAPEHPVPDEVVLRLVRLRLAELRPPGPAA